jgi:hypothetical protein
LIDWIGGIGTSLRSAFQHCFAVFLKKKYPLKSAYLGLNTERSEVLEPHEMGFERHQALKYRIAAIEHHEVAFKNSSGTSCRSTASLRSSFNSSFIIQFIIHHSSFIIHHSSLLQQYRLL